MEKIKTTRAKSVRKKAIKKIARPPRIKKVWGDKPIKVKMR
jgi:hypothetical protein